MWERALASWTPLTTAFHASDSPQHSPIHQNQRRLHYWNTSRLSSTVYFTSRTVCFDRDNTINKEWLYGGDVSQSHVASVKSRKQTVDHSGFDKAQIEQKSAQVTLEGSHVDTIWSDAGRMFHVCEVMPGRVQLSTVSDYTGVWYLLIQSMKPISPKSTQHGHPCTGNAQWVPDEGRAVMLCGWQWRQVWLVFGCR